MVPVVVALALGPLVPDHPDPLVRRCLVAYRAAAAAYRRVAAEARVTYFGRDGRAQPMGEWDELADGDRELQTLYPAGRGQPADGVWAANPGYSFLLNRDAAGWKVWSVGGGQPETVPTKGRRPFGGTSVFARPLVTLSARRAVWRGEPVAELVYEFAHPPLADGDQYRHVGGLFLRLDGPGTVAGWRFYYPHGPDRWQQEEVYAYRSDDGPWPGLASVEHWVTDRTAGDAPWRIGRTEFGRYRRPDRSPDPARVTLTGFGLPEPTDLPHPEAGGGSGVAVDLNAIALPPPPLWRTWPLWAGVVVAGVVVAAAVVWGLRRAVGRLDAG